MCEVQCPPRVRAGLPFTQVVTLKLSLGDEQEVANMIGSWNSRQQGDSLVEG